MGGKTEITKQEYNSALKLVSDYEKQEALKRSNIFSYDQEIILKGDKRTYFFKEYDTENDTVLISNCHSDDNDVQYDDYWVDFDKIENLNNKK